MAASSRQQCPMSCVRLRLLSQILRCGKGLFFSCRSIKTKRRQKNNMNFWNTFAALFSNFGALTWQMVVMWGHRCPAHLPCHRKKKMEPSLLLPMGFGAILVNLPASGAITQGRHRWPHLCPVRGRYVQRAVPAAAVHRHRCHDRFWPAAGKAVAHAVWRSGTVRHLFSPCFWPGSSLI